MIQLSSLCSQQPRGFSEKRGFNLTFTFAFIATSFVVTRSNEPCHVTGGVTTVSAREDGDRRYAGASPPHLCALGRFSRSPQLLKPGEERWAGAARSVDKRRVRRVRFQPFPLPEEDAADDGPMISSLKQTFSRKLAWAPITSAGKRVKCRWKHLKYEISKSQMSCKTCHWTADGWC